MTALEKASELNQRIAAGEVSREEAIRLFMEAGDPRGVALRRISFLLGQRRDDPLPEPATLPAGLGL